MKNYHYYGQVQKGNKIVRVAMSGIFKEEENLLQIGIAECNPKDKFDKKLGRIISSGRAEKNPTITRTLESNLIVGKTFVNICKDYLGIKETVNDNVYQNEGILLTE